MFRKLLDQGQAGDNVGILLRGTKREGDAPIRWWYNSRSQGADGMKTANSDSLLAGAQASATSC